VAALSSRKCYEVATATDTKQRHRPLEVIDKNAGTSCATKSRLLRRALPSSPECSNVNSYENWCRTSFHLNGRNVPCGGRAGKSCAGATCTRNGRRLSSKAKHGLLTKFPTGRNKKNKHHGLKTGRPDYYHLFGAKVFKLDRDVRSPRRSSRLRRHLLGLGVDGRPLRRHALQSLVSMSKLGSVPRCRTNQGAQLVSSPLLSFFLPSPMLVFFAPPLSPLPPPPPSLPFPLPTHFTISPRPLFKLLFFRPFPLLRPLPFLLGVSYSFSNLPACSGVYNMMRVRKGAHVRTPWSVIASLTRLRLRRFNQAMIQLQKKKKKKKYTNKSNKHVAHDLPGRHTPPPPVNPTRGI